MSSGIADALAAAATEALFGKKRPTVEIDRQQYQQWSQQFVELEQRVQDLQRIARDSELTAIQRTQQLALKDDEFTQEKMLRLGREDELKRLRGQLDQVGFAPDVDVRLSEESIAVNFIETRIRAFARMQGLDVSSGSVKTISQYFNNEQRQACNILLIASADFKVYQDYVAEVVSAMTGLINDLNDEPLSGLDSQQRSELVLALNRIRITLMERMTEIHRPHSQVAQQWIGHRAKTISQSIRLQQVEGGKYRIAPESIPQIASADLLSIPNARMNGVVDAIQERLSEEAKPILIAEGFASEYLFPSAYHTNAFGLQNYLMPVKP